MYGNVFDPTAAQHATQVVERGLTGRNSINLKRAVMTLSKIDFRGFPTERQAAMKALHRLFELNPGGEIGGLAVTALTTVGGDSSEFRTLLCDDIQHLAETSDPRAHHIAEGWLRALKGIPATDRDTVTRLLDISYKTNHQRLFVDLIAALSFLAHGSQEAIEVVRDHALTEKIVAKVKALIAEMTASISKMEATRARGSLIALRDRLQALERVIRPWTVYAARNRRETPKACSTIVERHETQGPETQSP